MHQVLYIAQVADASPSSATSTLTTPMQIAHIVRPSGSLLGLQMAAIESAGELEAGVCRQCGYVELYVEDPSSIPIDGTSVREIVAPTAG